MGADCYMGGGSTGELAWSRSGDPRLPAVIGLHGTPGGRQSAIPPSEVLADLGIQYLTFDRPGYGDSPRRPGRTVASVADDVRAVADDAGVDRFAVVGGSGGTAHALAAGALLPERVVSVTLIVPTAPRVGEPSMGHDAWFAGMDPGMAGMHQLAIDDPSALRAAAAGAMGEAADGVLDGLVEDLVSTHQDWAFDLREVKAPVSIWYGTDDVNAPATQALWLATQLPQATLHPQSGDHSWPATKMPAIFTAIAETMR